MNISTESQNPKESGDTKPAETVEPKSVLYRGAIGTISVLWFSFLPMYFIMIYMFNRHFFSFEFLSDNVFGMNALVIFGLELLLILSFYLFGFIPIGIWLNHRLKTEKVEYALRVAIVKARKEYHKKWAKYNSVIFILTCLAIWAHLKLQVDFTYIGKPERYYGCSFFALILCSYLAYSIYEFLKKKFCNWIPTALFITASAIAPLMSTETTAGLVENTLQAFHVGGGVPVKVTQWKDQKLVIQGKLLLRTPTNLYVSMPKEGKTITTVLHYNNSFRIDVEGTQIK